jgi:hypothetical protein
VAALVVAASLITPTLAWAKYRASGSETNVFATRVFLAPGTPTCGGINLLQVTLSWTAPTDVAYIDSYEFGTGTSAGGPFSFADNAMATSKTISVPGLSTRYYVVRTTRDLWRGANSAPRQVVGLLALATCP